jgi:hypothetical protein
LPDAFPLCLDPHQKRTSGTLGLISAFSSQECRKDEERPMGRGLLLWLIGIPLPIILIIWLFGGLS